MTASERGVLYRCPVCGAEIMVLVRRHGVFEPRCCNAPMLRIVRRPAFLVCPVCGTQVAVWRPHAAGLALRCCNQPLRAMAA
jgi:predicted RNA-binding Zn-ribbon protein involved in translation (DUF1610 family)